MNAINRRLFGRGISNGGKRCGCPVCIRNDSLSVFRLKKRIDQDMDLVLIAEHDVAIKIVYNEQLHYNCHYDSQ
ncbi:hypothetical protein DERF_009008 [Dermatophagoides farinae]|uniref:Uncharacterized protein n=1 Tax=Dermatophagoides farinae TaxID=6954 RepID=A0A922L593_DERFA|nr:hypothetical protein DERF_009008 [Dermatophagoides farinae]